MSTSREEESGKEGTRGGELSELDGCVLGLERLDFGCRAAKEQAQGGDGDGSNLVSAVNTGSNMHTTSVDNNIPMIELKVLVDYAMGKGCNR